MPSTVFSMPASKPVYTYNFSGYLPERFVRIREKRNEITEFTRMLDETRIKALAGNWLREAQTCRYDGSGLEFVN
jgi:hypothetical protein